MGGLAEVAGSGLTGEAGLAASSDDIAPSQIYAYAFLKLGIPYCNGAPNSCNLVQKLRKKGVVHSI